MKTLTENIDTNYIQLTLNILPEREREIVQLRLGFETGHNHSFEEIGALYNITKQRACQLFHAGINRLKKILAA